MAELLLELFSEEIPAAMQARAADDLKRLVTTRLEQAKLGVTTAQAFATPRRLALVVDGIPEMQPDSREQRRGPREGAPAAAVDGFLRSTGLGRDDLELRETDRGRFYFATIERKGGPTAILIGVMVADIIQNFPWPKSMRWGAGSLRWVRPLHNVLCLFAGKPVAIDLSDGVPVVARSFGHRFLAPAAFEVASYGDYRAKLEAARVMLDANDRQAAIVSDAGALAKGHGLELRPDAELLAEVAGLVEWPVVLSGAIDPRFMALPGEVLITSMKAHQRYFPLYRADGTLAPRFIVVANMVARDGGKAITAGNERVLRARLHDAEFLWQQDRKRSLQARLPKLDGIVFQAKLGSVGDKVRRVEALAGILAAHVPGAEARSVRRAAQLCKADLVSGMVHEFPELQGIMGRYYALNDGEPEVVANAIADHYAPLGPSDRCPNAPTSVAVALADKIDSLVGFWIIDEKPTGSKDPFALRRAALGVIRLIVENRLRLPLINLFEAASERVRNTMPGTGTFARGQALKTVKGWRRQIDSVALDLLEFIADRMKVALREKGVRHDLIDAVLGVESEDDLVRLLARVEALERFLGTDDGVNLLAAYRRASNIVRIEEKKDKTSYDGEPERARLVAAEEAELYHRLTDSAAAIQRALPAEDFAGAMAALSALRGPVDGFFDKVTVNCDDPVLRANRLRLLSRVRAAIAPVADFSRVEG